MNYYEELDELYEMSNAPVSKRLNLLPAAMKWLKNAMMHSFAR